MSADLFVGIAFTERLEGRREHMESVVRGAPPGTTVFWSGDEEAPKGRWNGLIRDDATRFAGVSPRRAWLALTTNAQTTVGNSRRAARRQAWALAAQRVLKRQPIAIERRPVNPRLDDLSRKHLRMLE